VTRDRELPSSGSTVTFTAALIGPSIPWSAQCLGGLIAGISEVILRWAEPMRRVVTHFEPTRGAFGAGLAIAGALVIIGSAPKGP
jgi:hypothetical protein